MHTVKVYKVILADGCSFRESRPANAVTPVDGEFRTCGHPAHYPHQYTARYEYLGKDTIFDAEV